MAEATLNDVIARLRLDNEKQLKEQSETTDAVNTLSGRLTALLVYLELQALKNQELLSELKGNREASAATVSAAGGSDTSSMPNLLMLGPLGAIASSLASLGGAAAALVAATEGLGPSIRDIRRFTQFFTFPARFFDNLPRVFGDQTLSQYIATQLTRLQEFFTARFTFDPRAGRYRNLETGRFGSPGYFQRILSRLNDLLGNISRIFSNIRIPESVTRAFDDFANMFRQGGRFANLMQGLRNNAFIRGFTRLLRPIAAIISLFDGFRNAAEEMEDREGFFNRYLGGGVGGFVSGTLGSFFGEFFNFIKWAVFWPIKQLFPAEWLTENADGSVSINRDANLFTNILGGIESIDFNRMITDIVQVPFDALAAAFDFVTDFATGEDDARSRAAAYWEENGILGAAADFGEWALNLIMTPINGILREVETAFFGADPERDRQTFTERVANYATQLYEWFNSIIPSMDEIKASIARFLGPGNLTDWLGLSDYLPMSTDDAERRLSNLFEEINDSFADINRFSSQLEGLDPNSLAYGDVASQLETARRELEQDRAEATAALARARESGVSQQVINNYQSAVDNWNISMPPTTDGNDPLLPSFN